jgi:hypothetical protein
MIASGFKLPYAIAMANGNPRDCLTAAMWRDQNER